MTSSFRCHCNIDVNKSYYFGKFIQSQLNVRSSYIHFINMNCSEDFFPNTDGLLLLSRDRQFCGHLFDGGTGGRTRSGLISISAQSFSWKCFSAQSYSNRQQQWFVDTNRVCENGNRYFSFITCWHYPGDVFYAPCVRSFEPHFTSPHGSPSRTSMRSSSFLGVPLHI